MSRKGAKGRAPNRVRSRGTKPKIRVSPGRTSVAELKGRLEARNRELAELREQLAEAQEQQTATSEVLKIISSSPGELEAVFQAMLENATRLSQAKFGILYLSEGGGLRAAALHGAPQLFAEERRRNPVIHPYPESSLGQALATKEPVQIANVQNEPDYSNAPSGSTGVQLAKLAHARTVLFVPMVKENQFTASS